MPAALPIESAAPGSRYVFNPAGQTLEIGGLLCLHDAEGPCANAVKDSQRSETHAGTRATLCIIWSTLGMAERVDAMLAWYRELHEERGIGTEGLTLS